MQIHEFNDRDPLFDSLLERFVDGLRTALDERDRATLLVSGGSTPLPLYRALANTDIDWSRVDVALVDERWVSVENEASNEGMIRRVLLSGHAADARLTGMMNKYPTPATGAAECDRRYAALPKPYDLCLLGMGPDGHTASLFPGARGLESAIRRRSHCAAIEARPSAVTGENLLRMTMTPWSLLQSRRLVLLITGEDKRRVLQQARQSGTSGDLPISLFIHQQETPLEVYWAP